MIVNNTNKYMRIISHQTKRHPQEEETKYNNMNNNSLKMTKSKLLKRSNKMIIITINWNRL